MDTGNLAHLRHLPQPCGGHPGRAVVPGLRDPKRPPQPTARNASNSWLAGVLEQPERRQPHLRVARADWLHTSASLAPSSTLHRWTSAASPRRRTACRGPCSRYRRRVTGTGWASSGPPTPSTRTPTRLLCPGCSARPVGDPLSVARTGFLMPPTANMLSREAFPRPARGDVYGARSPSHATGSCLRPLAPCGQPSSLLSIPGAINLGWVRQGSSPSPPFVGRAPEVHKPGLERPGCWTEAVCRQGP
jgi:hypothetical protein